MTTAKEKMTDYPETLTVTLKTETKVEVIKLASSIQKNKKRVKGEATARFTPASLCRVGLELLLAHSKELEQIQFKDEADFTKQIKTLFKH